MVTKTTQITLASGETMVNTTTSKTTWSRAGARNRGAHLYSENTFSELREAVSMVMAEKASDDAVAEFEHW